MSGGERSLVIAPQWIGDAVMSEPLIARLAAQGQRIAVAALPWVAPVYRAMPHVGEVIELPFAHRRLDLAARWRIGRALGGRFEAAFVLPNSWKSALIPWFAGIPRRVGYLGEGRHVLLNVTLPNPVGRPPMVAFYSALAAPTANISGADPARPRLSIEPSMQTRVCGEVKLDVGAYFVFAPGAEYGPAKRWPAGHYAALARELHFRHRQPIALLGSAQELELCERIAADAPGCCTVLAGRVSLLESMALIAASRGLVSNDSGLMHVAAAFGVPQVALFGSTSPEHTPPLNPHARVLWLKQELQLDCAPCFDRVCRFGHTRCLTGIVPGRVVAALDTSLQSAAAS